MGLAVEEELEIELNMNLQPLEQDLAIGPFGVYSSCLGHCCHDKHGY